MGFSRQEYWSGFPIPSPGDLPNPGIEPESSTLQTDSLLSEPPWKPRNVHILILKRLLLKKKMLSSEPPVTHNLFASGGSEILQELPKCDTKTESEQMLLGQWYQLT